MLDQVNHTHDFQGTEGVGRLQDAYVLPGSCVTLAQVSSESIAYYDVFRVSTFRAMQYHLLSKQPLDRFSPLPPRSDRTDFQGITLNAAAVFYHPKRFFGFDSYEHPEVDTIPKVNYPIIKTLTEQLNFSITLIILEDYGWQTNMTFSGLIGLLQREEIDMGATGVFMRPDRIVTIDFTGDTFEIKSKLIFKQPALSSVSNIYVLPFTKLVWISCSGLILLTALLLLIDALVTVGNRQAFYEEVTPLDIATIIIGCVCQQGSYLVPKSGSAKTILFLFSLCAMFFYTSYSANIVSLLQSTSPTLRSLTDLTSSPLSVGIQNVIYNEIYFAEATDREITEFYKKKVAPQGNKAFLSPEEGIKKVRSGLFAYEVETHWGYKIISDTFLENEKCVIDEMRLFLLPMTSIPVIKKSGYREIFTVKNTLQRDIGLHSRIRRRWLPTKPECEGRGGGYVSVGITDFIPALLVLSYGFLVSFAVLVIEIIIYFRSKIMKNCARRATVEIFRPGI